MIIIINDDEHYLRWIEENPSGFVVNAQNPPSSKNLNLHRSTCSDISSSKRSNWTTKDYLKVCSSNANELAMWASKVKGGELTPCQRCKPDTSYQAAKTSEQSAAVSKTVFSNEAELPFIKYPGQGRQLLGKLPTSNSRHGYGLKLQCMTGQSTCAYCGVSLTDTYEHWLLLQVDHVIPSSMGNRLEIPVKWLEDYSNTVLACSGCNSFENRFDDLTIKSAPESESEFFDLRDAVFIQRKPLISLCQNAERSFFEGKPWEHE